MRNEFILILMLLVSYSSVILMYRVWGRGGLYSFMVLATIAANIEVMILVNAFGMEQTLGNVLFASTFLVTDVLSELEGKKAAKKAANIGIVASIGFVLISQTWMLYEPSANDQMAGLIRQVFTNTPRVMLSSIVVFAIVQRFDVWAYHFIWSKTTEKLADKSKLLWLRNNLATLISQFLNTLLFNIAAFIGVYDWGTVWAITISSYVIFVFTSILDTPFIYGARKLGKRVEA